MGLVKYHVQRDTGADVWCIQQDPEPREISKYLTSLYFQQAFALHKWVRLCVVVVVVVAQTAQSAETNELRRNMR